MTAGAGGMRGRGGPVAVLAAASWIGLLAAPQNAPPGPGAASQDPPEAAGTACGAQEPANPGAAQEPAGSPGAAQEPASPGADREPASSPGAAQEPASSPGAAQEPASSPGAAQEPVGAVGADREGAPADPPDSDPPVTDPPGADPPVTDPPGADPPVTDPPGADPPVTDPPGADPPVTDPSGVGPPDSDPPGAERDEAEGDEAEGDEAETEPEAPEPPPQVMEIGDGLYVLPYCGNATARVTPHGVVLVGDRLAQYRAGIERLLATVTDRRITYEVRTHRHGEDADPAAVAPDARHLAPARAGDPAPPAEAAPPDAEAAPPDAEAAPPDAEAAPPDTEAAPPDAEAAPPDAEAAPPDAEAAPPDIVFSARLSLFLGDAEIGLHRVGSGHTGGDAVVLFPDRRAVHAGHLVAEGAPVIDYAVGGSMEGWIASLDALLALDFDTLIPGTLIPGTGPPVLQKSEALAFRDRLVTLRTRIQQLVRHGIAKEDAAAHLQTDDLGWPLEPDGDFARETLPALYDEIAGGP